MELASITWTTGGVIRPRRISNAIINMRWNKLHLRQESVGENVTRRHCTIQCSLVLFAGLLTRGGDTFIGLISGTLQLSPWRIHQKRFMWESFGVSGDRSHQMVSKLLPCFLLCLILEFSSYIWHRGKLTQLRQRVNNATNETPIKAQCKKKSCRRGYNLCTFSSSRRCFIEH